MVHLSILHRGLLSLLLRAIRLLAVQLEVASVRWGASTYWCCFRRYWRRQHERFHNTGYVW